MPNQFQEQYICANDTKSCEFFSEYWDPNLQYLHILRSASFSVFLSQMFSVFYLKVPSGQIGSTWEWYHWISLEKDINHYRFLIFKFYSWIFEKTSKFWAASCKNQSNLLLVQITVCIESCIPIGWRTFIWWKICQSALLFLFSLHDVGLLYSQAVIQRTIDVSSAFLEQGSAEKITVWAHADHDPNKQEVGFICA